METDESIYVGRKEALAFIVRFEADPDDGLNAIAEESMSWGALEVWVDGTNLCEHQENGQIVSSVHWYVLPIIEWLAANWDPLLHEERLPNMNAGDDAWSSLTATRFPPESLQEDEERLWFEHWQGWWNRHSLRAARCGGLFPDLVIRRWQDLVEVSWGDRPVAGIPDDIVFMRSRGVSRLSPASVAEPLYRLLQKTTDFLIKRLNHSERLASVAEQIEQIRKPPGRDRMAWLAGLGSSYDKIRDEWDTISSMICTKNGEVADYLLEVAGNELVIEGSCHATLMFGSAAPTLCVDDMHLLAEKLIELYAPDSEKLELRKLVDPKPITFQEAPWETGYALAEGLIDSLSLDAPGCEWIDISGILNRLGIREERIRLSDKNIRGLSIAGPRHLPSILINESDSCNDTLPGRRFTLAHELCHILFDRVYGLKLAMVSDFWAPLQIEKRANAFAAMLLMPRGLVRRVVASLTVRLATEQGIHEVRKRLRTSFKATLDHLTNLEWLDPVTAEKIAEVREQRLSRQEDM